MRREFSSKKCVIIIKIYNTWKLFNENCYYEIFKYPYQDTNKKKTVKKVMYIWEQTRLLLLIIFKNKELIIDFYHLLKFRELKKKKRNGELKR